MRELSTLTANVQQQLQCVRELEAYEAEKTQAFQNAQRLQAIADKQDQVLQGWTRLQQEHQQLFERIVPDQDFHHWLSSQDRTADVQKLAESWDSLAQALQALRGQVQENEALLQDGLAYIEYSLKVLQATEEYSYSKKKPGVTSRILDRKV